MRQRRKGAGQSDRPARMALVRQDPLHFAEWRLANRGACENPVRLVDGKFPEKSGFHWSVYLAPALQIRWQIRQPMRTVMSIIDLASERMRRETFKPTKRKPAAAPAYKASISVFGLGYVGAVSAACLADTNHRVVGVDPDVRKTAMLANGKAMMVEPGLDDLLTKGVEAELIGVSADAEYAVFNSTISFVCVGTPSREDGSCDIGYVEDVARSIGKAIRAKKEFHVIAFRSTIPPGTCRQILGPIIEKESGGVMGEDFGIAFHPEFLRECTAIEDFYNPPKTVVGASDERTQRIIADIYDGVVDILDHLGRFDAGEQP